MKEKEQKKPLMLKVDGATEHNLKNVSLHIPHNSLTVITGVSGSGKSTLAYNVIFRESQRRFLSSFSAYSRQYIGKLEKPAVRSITGLPPALAINQKTVIANPRSTVGTMSGIYDYLRLLYARAGKPEGISEEDLQDGILAKLFSFNTPYGACPLCKGLGITEQIDKDKLISDPNLSLRQGALVPTTPNGYIVYSQVRVDELDKVCRAHGFTVDVPWKELSPEQQDVIWYGSEKVKILFGKHSLESRLRWKGITAKPREESYYKGMITIMEDILKRDRNDNILRFASSVRCPSCNGDRLNKKALSVRVNGRNIAELCHYPLRQLQSSLRELEAHLSGNIVSEHILYHIFKRLEYLKMLGLDYLSLSRESTSLSGGEAQRIRLASQLGSGLQGILYILDEPSIGLHSIDNQKMLAVLRSLRDNGNTLLVVEHDEQTILSADHLVDMGPGAGLDGGQIIFQGEPEHLLRNAKSFPLSLTALHLSGGSEDPVPLTGRLPIGTISIRSASAFNLKNIDVHFKMGVFNVVTGVSGAGKSTLVHHVLARHLKSGLNDGSFEHIECSVPVSRVIDIDQSPIGRTPRSNPATYTDLFDHIRTLFARQPEAIKRNYKKGRFSFNNVGGRCEKCQGAGLIHLGMHFLGDVEIVCDECHGRRFNNDTLEVRYHKKSIAEVLDLSVNEARIFFDGETRITRILDKLIELDVGYLKLGQPSTTLSGGEAQRVKLASELYKTGRGHGLYILDEPSTGLHKADIRHLLVALHGIVDNNNTVIVIEHDPDIIRQADHVVDLGPEGGDEGGSLMVEGKLSALLNCQHSLTGKALREEWDKHSFSDIKRHKAGRSDHMTFRGVSTNNLKNIDVGIPLDKITVITGLSGSGKSSLAFDTLYAESRNRFTESLSTYARRMMNKVKRPELEESSGLTPAIAVRQDRFSKNPRSTVGTISGIFDLYRLLFSRAGINENGTHTSLSASMFSFNTLESACPGCKGLGIVTVADPEKFITHPGRSLLEGALDGTLPGKFFGDPYGQYVNTLIKVGEKNGIDYSQPYERLSPIARDIALNGTGAEEYDVEWKFRRGSRTGIHNMTVSWKGFKHYLSEDYELKQHGARGRAYQMIMSDLPCPECGGERFRPHILEVRYNGMNISELSALSVSGAEKYFNKLSQRLEQDKSDPFAQIIHQLLEKLRMLRDIGLPYLRIDRTTNSLSGGEAQRLRIASQLVSDLCGLTYILDEPTIGLHPRDTQNLMKAIRRLNAGGNTIVMVEHDRDVIEQADHIIDIGPGAGNKGGEIIASGSPGEIRNNPASITGKYLSSIRHRRQAPPTGFRNGISVRGARARNLKRIDIDIPSGMLTVVTGVSGSGKTSLVFDVIAASVATGHPVKCDGVSAENFNSTVVIDQEKIGSSPLSTPATYTGLFDHIREIFARQDQARAAGLKKSHFSFNSKEGRCPVCKGMGSLTSSLDFLSDIRVVCDACHGRRFQEQILEIKYKGHNIHDILELEIGESLPLFQDHATIMNILETLNEAGLGYVRLGQATSTLSGGETQRLKLASGLLKKSNGNTLYLFDEPSTGLHAHDVEKLILTLKKLTEQGNTVIVVEHNTAIIGAADRAIDLGPEGGEGGGKLMYSGTPEQMQDCEESYTGQALKKAFA